MAGDDAPGRVSPPPAFAAQANVDADPRERFDREWPDAWSEAADLLSWDDPYDRVFADGPPFAWFPGGELNAARNCVDRHAEARKNQLAVVWEGRDGERRSLTYLDLHREVNEFAAALRDLGVAEDDVVTLYMPMVPELPIAMLACARIGAVHNVVYAEFSADALTTRMRRAGSAVLVTCDGYYQRGSAVNLKRKADNARIDLDADVTVVVADRLGSDVHLGEGYHAYADLLAAHAGERVTPVPRAAGDRLFRIYTSGTTGQPKAVDHVTGGYLAQVAWTTRAVLDVKPADTYWCAADVSWITGHSYAVYGPLALGATTVLAEEGPDQGAVERTWSRVERNAVDVLYTSPTAIRAFMKRRPEGPTDHDLSSLRLLGSVGEPLSASVREWYREHVGGDACPVVDTWWQTETGAILVATLPGVDDAKPGAAGRPLPGVEVEVVDETGDPVAPGEDGYLTVTRPWPAMPRSLLTGEGWADAPRADWRYYPEDSARVDEDGYVTVLGRVDDVVNVAGRRFSTLEIESAIVGVEGVAEAAVVVGDHPTRGRAIHAYVSSERGHSDDDALRERVVRGVERAVGPVATPEAVVFTPELPKTRSGKIMRRLLAAVSNGDDLGDTSALRNPEVVGELRSDEE